MTTVSMAMYKVMMPGGHIASRIELKDTASGLPITSMEITPEQLGELLLSKEIEAEAEFIPTVSQAELYGMLHEVRTVYCVKTPIKEQKEEVLEDFQRNYADDGGWTILSDGLNGRGGRSRSMHPSEHEYRIERYVKEG